MSIRSDIKCASCGASAIGMLSPQLAISFVADRVRKEMPLNMSAYPKEDADLLRAGGRISSKNWAGGVACKHCGYLSATYYKEKGISNFHDFLFGNITRDITERNEAAQRRLVVRIDSDVMAIRAGEVLEISIIGSSASIKRVNG